MRIGLKIVFFVVSLVASFVEAFRISEGYGNIVREREFPISKTQYRMFKWRGGVIKRALES